MVGDKTASVIKNLPEWAKKMYIENGSPDLKETEDVFHGPLIDRKHGLRKDDLIEISIDDRVLSQKENRKIGGMLIGTTRNVSRYIRY